ncbi:MAG: OmpA family protein [bacterium]|nr:OmpA family protein [bacterium]
MARRALTRRSGTTNSGPGRDHVAVTLTCGPSSWSSRANYVRLSQRRAEAVRDYLAGTGLAADRMVAKGYGPDKPIAANDTEEGRAQNRRTELNTTSSARAGCVGADESREDRSCVPPRQIDRTARLWLNALHHRCLTTW